MSPVLPIRPIPVIPNLPTTIGTAPSEEQPTAPNVVPYVAGAAGIAGLGLYAYQQTDRLVSHSARRLLAKAASDVSSPTRDRALAAIREPHDAVTRRAFSMANRLLTGDTAAGQAAVDATQDRARWALTGLADRLKNDSGLRTKFGIANAADVFSGDEIRTLARKPQAMLTDVPRLAEVAKHLDMKISPGESPAAFALRLAQKGGVDLSEKAARAVADVSKLGAHPGGLAHAQYDAARGATSLIRQPKLRNYLATQTYAASPQGVAIAAATKNGLGTLASLNKGLQAGWVLKGGLGGLGSETLNGVKSLKSGTGLLSAALSVATAAPELLSTAQQHGVVSREVGNVVGKTGGGLIGSFAGWGAGTFIGGIVGPAVGAAVAGTFIGGPIGTVVGGVAGIACALIGSMIGNKLGETIGNKLGDALSGIGNLFGIGGAEEPSSDRGRVPERGATAEPYGNARNYH